MSYPNDPAQMPGPQPPPPAGYGNYQGQQAYPGYQGYQGPPPAAPGYGTYPTHPAPMGGPGWGPPVSSAGRRFGAYLLDAVLILVTLFIGWLIWSLIIWSKGQSPAKSLLGMRCVRTDTGQAATWGTMALRELVGKMLLANFTFGITTLVSAIMILSDNDRREGLWDKIANTVVVDDPEGRLVA
jgi:uncharacterized RDD family membrane protein YckC